MRQRDGGLIRQTDLVRLIMAATALILGAAGAALLFMPREVDAFLDLGMGAEFVLQVLGAGFLAVATLNWMGRGAIYGGVFGRPIITANLMFGVVSSLSVTSALLRGAAHPLLWGVAVVLGMHTLAFGYLLRSPPYPEHRSA